MPIRLTSGAHPTALCCRFTGAAMCTTQTSSMPPAVWRAGADSPGGFATKLDPHTGRKELAGFASDVAHIWSLEYDPNGNDGAGSTSVTMDGERCVCHLEPGHKQGGAVFNRFGLLAIPKHLDQGGEVWLDDLIVNGEAEAFDEGPGWEGRGNRHTYTTYDVRPRFDFGFSDSSFAGGRNRGELGGVVFCGDIRYLKRMAYHADRLARLSIDRPLWAAGKVSLRRGMSDSTSQLGFLDSQRSTTRTDSQDSNLPLNVLGVVVEGPSRNGFLLLSGVPIGQRRAGPRIVAKSAAYSA